jgi:hypothetical protein
MTREGQGSQLLRHIISQTLPDVYLFRVDVVFKENSK